MRTLRVIAGYVCSRLWRDRHIAIFYGLAHLPDLARRLESDIGLTRRDANWIDAWDLRADPSH